MFTPIMNKCCSLKIVINFCLKSPWLLFHWKTPFTHSICISSPLHLRRGGNSVRVFSHPNRVLRWSSGSHSLDCTVEIDITSAHGCTNSPRLISKLIRPCKNEEISLYSVPVGSLCVHGKVIA